jgi:hypothetical protein
LRKTAWSLPVRLQRRDAPRAVGVELQQVAANLQVGSMSGQAHECVRVW